MKVMIDRDLAELYEVEKSTQSGSEERFVNGTGSVYESTESELTK
jgi:hypothetical protein